MWSTSFVSGFKGKELTEIGGMICDHCLAPDTRDEGIGCDNSMTILIVAITHGRSKEEWYAWIADRVRNNYGYDTPSTLPQLYPQDQLMAFRAGMESYDKFHREREEKAAAERNASTSVQSAPSSTQACSQNGPSPGRITVQYIMYVALRVTIVSTSLLSSSPSFLSHSFPRI